MIAMEWTGREGVAFFVRGDEIRGLVDLDISTSALTNEQYVWEDIIDRMTGEPTGSKGHEKIFRPANRANSYSVSIKALLMEALGTANVRESAMNIMESARMCEEGYLYVAEEKLIPATFVMVDAKISKVVINSAGHWASCEMALKFEQSSPYAGPKEKKVHETYLNGVVKKEPGDEEEDEEESGSGGQIGVDKQAAAKRGETKNDAKIDKATAVVRTAQAGATAYSTGSGKNTVIAGKIIAN